MIDTQFEGRFSKSQSAPLWLEEIPLRTATLFVREHHYSKVMPKQTKVVLGIHKGEGGVLVGVITLGWGVRPKDTIRRLFPSLEKDCKKSVADIYLEIGKLCVRDEEPKNTESRILALTIKWLRKNKPKLKVLFTWADGMWGKPGYIYQAANFYYGGAVVTDVYVDKDNVRFHPRQLPAMLREKEGMSVEDIRKNKYCDECKETHSFGANNGVGSRRPCKQQLRDLKWRHYFGSQFRYAYFFTNEKETQELIADSAWKRRIKYMATISKRVNGKLIRTPREMTPVKPSIFWVRPIEKNQKIYPKFSDITWKVDDGIPKEGKSSKPVQCSQPKLSSAFDPRKTRKEARFSEHH